MRASALKEHDDPMYLSIKTLTEEERDICTRTLSHRAVFALVGDAVARKEGLSIVRMADGEYWLLEARDGQPYTRFGHDWNVRYGIDGLKIEEVKRKIIEAGNNCTYFAPSVSGISLDDFRIYDRFNRRDHYVDNFFVNDWTKEMIGILLRASDGVFVMHAEYDKLIRNFVDHYDLPASFFAGFEKRSWSDNDAAVAAAIDSGKQLVLFSAGPAGKIVAPEIGKAGRVVLDVGAALPLWSSY